jgi:hypothetical protein
VRQGLNSILSIRRISHNKYNLRRFNNVGKLARASEGEKELFTKPIFCCSALETDNENGWRWMKKILPRASVPATRNTFK